MTLTAKQINVSREISSSCIRLASGARYHIITQIGSVYHICRLYTRYSQYILPSFGGYIIPTPYV